MSISITRDLSRITIDVSVINESIVSGEIDTYFLDKELPIFIIVKHTRDFKLTAIRVVADGLCLVDGYDFENGELKADALARYSQDNDAYQLRGILKITKPTVSLRVVAFTE